MATNLENFNWFQKHINEFWELNLDNAVKALRGRNSPYYNQFSDEEVKQACLGLFEDDWEFCDFIRWRDIKTFQLNDHEKIEWIWSYMCKNGIIDEGGYYFQF